MTTRSDAHHNAVAAVEHSFALVSTAIHNLDDRRILAEFDLETSRLAVRYLARWVAILLRELAARDRHDLDAWWPQVIARVRRQTPWLP